MIRLKNGRKLRFDFERLSVSENQALGFQSTGSSELSMSLFLTYRHNESPQYVWHPVSDSSHTKFNHITSWSLTLDQANAPNQMFSDSLWNFRVTHSGDLGMNAKCYILNYRSEFLFMVVKTFFCLLKAYSISKWGWNTRYLMFLESSWVWGCLLFEGFK